MAYKYKKRFAKSINYLNKDFSDFKTNLIEFAKQYFPNTYNDLTEKVTQYDVY